MGTCTLSRSSAVQEDKREREREAKRYFHFVFQDGINSSMVYGDGVMPHRGKRCLNRIAGVMSLST